MAAVTDDDIIKRRLLIDGDCGNDDKRIGQLLRTFLKWYHSPDDDEENMIAYQKMMTILAQSEFTMESSVMEYEMNLKEQSRYEDLKKKIEDNIHSAQKQISECKNELQEAKKIRKHRQEYDNMAKVIQKHPDRKETTKQLASLDEEIKGLNESKSELETKLEVRKKQFHVLISAIHELQSILEVDENRSDAEDAITDVDMEGTT